MIHYRCILLSVEVYARLKAKLESLPLGLEVIVRDASRTSDQNAKFHAICSDLSSSKFPWAGKPRSREEWKVLLISGHAVATKHEAQVIPGLEGEFINIRESSALMSKKRAASLIEYSQAFCAANGVELGDDAK